MAVATTVHPAASAASARPRAALGGLSPAEFRKFSKAGAEVLGPYPVLLWMKSGNLAVVTALVDLSETGLISWFNSCAAVHALARMGCQQSEQLMATPAAELGAEMI